MFRFKIYFDDGTVDYCGGRGDTTFSLYNDFDGLMDWNEFNSLSDNNMTVKKVLVLAMECYKKMYEKNYYKIEIVNLDNNEVIDYIEK